MPFGFKTPSLSGLSKLTAEKAPESAAAKKGGGATLSGWRASLKQASFRGVPFEVEQREGEGGRRAVTHEFPGRDIPFTEDMGRKAAALTVEAYVLGKGYMAARDRLEAALNAEGPGALILPWNKEIKVECTTYRMRESAKEGGMARFSITFAEAGEESAPTGSALPGVTAEQKADDAIKAAGKNLDKTIKIAGVPVPVQESTLEGLQNLGSILSGTSGISRFAADLPSALKRLQKLKPSDLADLAPSELAGPLFSLASSFKAVSSAYRSTGGSSELSSRVSGMLEVAAAAQSVETPTGAGTVRSITAQNLGALAEYQRTAAVVEAARSAALVQPTSRQEADQLRVQIVDAIDTAMAGTTDAEVYSSLADLRTSTVRSLAESAGSAPEVATVQSTAVLPALVVAQRYVVSPGYGTDATEAEAELLARNSVRHPGFVPPGQLEVLRAV